MRLLLPQLPPADDAEQLVAGSSLREIAHVVVLGSDVQQPLGLNRGDGLNEVLRVSFTLWNTTHLGLFLTSDDRLISTSYVSLYPPPPTSMSFTVV